jgi:hypothetical protein
MKYLLPCTCGQSVEVEPGQAGQTVACVCGKSLLVPSMLQVKALLQAPEKPMSKRAESNALRRTFFVLGIVLLFSALLLAPYLYMWKPEPRHATFKPKYYTYGTNKRMLYQDSTPFSRAEHTILWIRDEHIDRMMPMELYFYFRTLEEPTFSYHFAENYEAVKDTYRIWVTVNVILFILALLSITVSFFIPRQTVVVTGWSGSEWQ